MTLDALDSQELHHQSLLKRMACASKEFVPHGRQRAFSLLSCCNQMAIVYLNLEFSELLLALLSQICPVLHKRKRSVEIFLAGQHACT